MTPSRLNAEVPGPHVLVVGSVNVDFVVRVARLPRPGETVTGGTFSRHMGGKGANQAVAAARLGARVTFVGAVGDDELGRHALAELSTEGVDVSRCLTIHGQPTGVAIIAVDDAGENQIAVASGANAALDEVRVGHALHDVLATGGAFLANLELSDGAVIGGTRHAQRQGMTIVLNPAPPRRLPDELLAMKPVLVPNESEASDLTGAPEPAAAGRQLALSTGGWVLVTRGSRGVLLVGRDGWLRELPASAVDAVDATGAGDTFAGALATELARGAPIEQAARFAVAAATLSVTRHGARAGMPTREQVDELLSR